jgi:hypothetical protein
MKYEIVISFASEEREIAKIINFGLKKAGVVTFYDEDHKSALWGKNLTEEFLKIFSIEGKYCLMILSQNYIRKMWTRHERRAALSRMIKESSEYILPYIVDETSMDEIEGMNPNTNYIKYTDIGPIDLIDLILSKIGKQTKLSEDDGIELACIFTINEIFRRSFDPIKNDYFPHPRKEMNYYRSLRDSFLQKYSADSHYPKNEKIYISN